MMLKKILVSIYFVLNTTLLFAQSTEEKMSLEQKLMLGEFDKKYESQKEDSAIWSIFIREFGDEKILVRFPENPELLCDYKKNKTSFSLQSRDDQAVYKLNIDPNEFEDIGQFIERKKAEIQSAPYYQIQDMQQKENVLDVIFFDSRRAQTYYKTHFLVTKQNIYTLCTQVEKGKKDQHQYYVDSFSVLSSDLL